MIRRLSGVVHGKTIELREDPGIADGEHVEVTIKPSDGPPSEEDVELAKKRIGQSGKRYTTEEVVSHLRSLE